jgi:PRTRC genetic system protein E
VTAALEGDLTLEERHEILRSCGLEPRRVRIETLERDAEFTPGEGSSSRPTWFLLTDTLTGLWSGTQCLARSSARAELRFTAGRLAEYLDRAGQPCALMTEVNVFQALSKLAPKEGDTLLLTLARDGEAWRVNVVPQLADAQLAEASTPLTLVASLEDLESGFVEALEGFSRATLPLLAQVEAAIAASHAAVEAAKQKASSKAAKPSSTGKASGSTKTPEKTEPVTTPSSPSGGLFDTPSSDEPDVNEVNADDSSTALPAEPDAEAERLSELQAQLQAQLEALNSERMTLVTKLNSAAKAAFELESAFVDDADTLHPSMGAIPLGKRFAEIAQKIRVFEERGVDALEEAA